LPSRGDGGEPPEYDGAGGAVDEGRGTCTERSPFTTAFVRPARFRYEIRRRRGEEEFDRCLAWRNGEDVRGWWDVKPGVVLGSPSSLLATATVVSGFTAARVPALFLPELPETHVTHLADVQRMEDEELAGATCFVVQGHWSGGTPITLWIDRRSFLLRQTLTEDFGRQMRTTYEPELDLEIPEAELVFDPPSVETR